MLFVIPILFAISLAGLAFVITRALSSGAEAYTGTYSADTARQFEDIFLFIPPRHIADAAWAFSVTAFVIVFFVAGSLTSMRGLVVGLAFGLTAGLLALGTPRRLLVFLKNRRRYRFNVQLIDTLMGMSNALKAGFSITQSLETVVRDGENPIAQEFGVFLQQTRVGVSFSQALANLEARVGSDDLTLMVTAIDNVRKTGGNLTEVFEKISATIRERMRIERRIRTLTAQGRLQGIVVGLMPILIGTALTIVDPEMMLPFMHSLVGIVVMCAVILLVLCGALIIRKIVNIDV